MAKSDLGTKRICPTTGKKFYDLNKIPGDLALYRRGRADRAGRAAARDARCCRRALQPQHGRPRRRSPPRAEDRCRSRKPTPRRTPARSRPSCRSSEDDIEIDETIEDDDDDDSTFIADEEEGDEDVTDIIGDVGADEET